MMVANVVLLNLLWFASVIGAANDLLWPAVLVLFLMLGFNYFCQSMKTIDFKIIVLSILAGLVFDGFLMYQGWIVYTSKELGLGPVPPLWIMVLWVGFGSSIRTGMQWLLKHPKIGGLLMFVAAPLSYVSAAKLGAVSLIEIWQALLFIAISWCFYFTAVVYLIAQVAAQVGTANSENDHAVA